MLRVLGDRFIKTHELVLQAFEDGFVYTSQKYSHKVLEFMEDGDDAAIEALILAEKVEKFSATEFTPVFRQHVESDPDTLRAIKQSWASVKRDPKWVEFERELTTQPGFTAGKLIIFSEFADTARYLAERIKKEVEPKTLLFSSDSSPEQRRDVIANFDANSKGRGDYRILVTTDTRQRRVLSGDETRAPQSTCTRDDAQPIISPALRDEAAQR
ncbi:MAG: hypothetical protein HY936_02755 [Nitrosomonadales bacterium]|nr:hypothetical protein [Nitrosomonadales bacterium]